jgi:hypothetical protein
VRRQKTAIKVVLIFCVGVGVGVAAWDAWKRYTAEPQGSAAWDTDVMPPRVEGRDAPVRRGSRVVWSDTVTSLRHSPLLAREALRVEFEPMLRRKYDLEKLDKVAGARKAGWKPGENDPFDYFHKPLKIGVEIDEQELLRRDETSIDPGGERRAAYFGALHSHTSYSDGEARPEDAFRMARDLGRLDFFAVTDHAEYWSGKDDRRWAAVRAAARRETSDRFVALAGFEYSNLWWGHYAVLNTEEYFAYNYLSWGVEPFYEWLRDPARREAFAIFAHPGFHFNHKGREHARYAFDPVLARRFVGIDVTQMGAWMPGVLGNGHGMSFYDEALTRGWTLGPMSAPDNHYANWGVRDAHRIGVLLPSLTQENLFDALRARRFYATTNENLQVAWGAWLRGGAWAPMGSSVARSSFAEDQWTFEFRFFDTMNKHVPRLFEVVVDEKVQGRLYYPISKTPPKKTGLEPVRVNLPPLTPGMAASVRVVIDGTRLAPSRAHRVYARFLQGRRGKHFTVTSPVWIQPAGEGE